MSNNTENNYEGWATKQEVARLLGVGEKTIDRMAEKGQIQKAMRKRVGLSSVAVFHPNDIARIKAERERQPVPFALPPDGHDADMPVSDMAVQEVSRNGAGLVRPTDLGHVVDALVQALSQPRREWRTWLTRKEAVEYTGLSEAYLKKAVSWRVGNGGFKVCRRKGLEDL